jgi:guanylate-binding protein 6
VKNNLDEKSLPKFLWLLRDFVLDLKENGRDITENEYLESRLQNCAKSKNYRNRKVRDALQKAFQKRELLTMVRPVEDDTKIQVLEQVPWRDMRD